MARKPFTPFLASPRPYAAFTTLNDRDHSGLKPNEFDYYFESKIDHGAFPHDYMSYMKVLGQDYDTNSEQHLANLEQMNNLNLDLMDNVQGTMQITPEEEKKLIKRGKFDARERIRRILDRGSPWLALG